MQLQRCVWQVGDGAASQSNTSSFRTLPEPPAAYRIGVLGGLGVTQNSSDTAARLARRCRSHEMAASLVTYLQDVGACLVTAVACLIKAVKGLAFC